MFPLLSCRSLPPGGQNESDMEQVTLVIDGSASHETGSCSSIQLHGGIHWRSVRRWRHCNSWSRLHVYVWSELTDQRPTYVKHHISRAIWVHWFSRFAACTFTYGGSTSTPRYVHGRKMGFTSSPLENLNHPIWEEWIRSYNLRSMYTDLGSVSMQKWLGLEANGWCRCCLHKFSALHRAAAVCSLSASLRKRSNKPPAGSSFFFSRLYDPRKHISKALIPRARLKKSFWVI